MVMRPRKARESTKVGPMKFAQILQERDSQFETLSRVSAMISQNESLEKGLAEALDYLVGLTGADIGTIHVLNPLKKELELLAARGVSKSFLAEERCIPAGDCLCGEAAVTGNLIQSSDLRRDDRLTRSACKKEKFGSVIGIPLKSRGAVVGVFSVYSRKAMHFSGADLKLLSLIGDQIGTAVENARRYAQTWERAVFQERMLMAQEIHDSIAQSLAYLNLQVKNLENMLNKDRSDTALAELKQVRSVIMETYEDVRQLMADFRTGFKPEEGFVGGISRLLQEFSHRTGIQTCFDTPDPYLHLPPLAEVQLFRIVQEALCNVRKHASASRVRLGLTSDASVARLSIEDNGRGFDPKEILTRETRHFGLEIMQERTHKLQGRLEIHSRPGSGTTLNISFPTDKGGVALR
jgi:two-component system nitrate/nitrite sensor histidine kinase NarX